MIPNPHALLTIVAPLALEKLSIAQAELDRFADELPSLAAQLGALDSGAEDGTHFMSLHAIASTDGKNAYLLLELSADGDTQAALARIVNAPELEQRFRRIFQLASDWRAGTALVDYWGGRIANMGPGYFDSPGLPFVGMPGFSVGRIRSEAKLAAAITTLLGAQPGDWAALRRLDAVRAELASDQAFGAMLQPADSGIAFKRASTLSAAVTGVWAFARTYLWPMFVTMVIWALAVGVCRAWGGGGIHAFLCGAWHGLWTGTLVALAVVIVALGAGYLAFRIGEDHDGTEDRAADHAINAEMFARENRCAQNHMISITRRKPGLLRAFTSRLVFLAIGTLGGKLYQPGFLSEIGTIHFARWLTPQGSKDVIFLSNYDGSWESYLEDFITRAHYGLTGVWSNSIGFPRAKNLVLQGATDGERFKRYARRSMVPTRFWFSAYPELSVGALRRNAAIRRGLSGALNEDEASEWLALFGSARRPNSRLVSSEIQSLVFGGMKFMPHGTCLVFDRLPADIQIARNLLATLLPLVAFNDGRLAGPSAVTLALGAGGLDRLGLPESALASFPFAFLDGMSSGTRGRILGDEATNAPVNWRWGTAAPDVALLVYGKTPADVARLEEAICVRAHAAGMAEPHPIPLLEVHEGKQEPFGFADGISQPVIRGTYKGLRNADPIHLVEPGEFILGYPDNRGNLPPGPVIAAIEDPANHLPLAVRSDGFDVNNANALRDLGCNGSFLVIRQLEQHVDKFWAYCEDESSRLAGRLPPPYLIDKEFVAAKMVGRWPDGSSLARNPYEPASRKADRMHETVRPKPATDAGTPPVDPPGRPANATRTYGDNDFLFGTEDPEGVRCPYGAHVRRANPRDSQDPGSADQIAISNRHRILRVGRRYAPVEGQDPGLLFMCLNSDIERQFEFLQQSWLRSPSFHGLSCEKDPLLGDAEKGMCGYTVPSRDGPVVLNPVPQFVTMRGGGYFFMPGKRLLEFLSSPVV
jgi:deferrochelatase/peroxidase EfeB